MPYYEYECEKCNHLFTKKQDITDDTIPPCPECNGKCKKLISLSSFKLNGPGFYVNDYKNKGK